MERHVMGFAVAVDLDVQTRRQRVDHGRADAVQTAGRVVGGIAELGAGVQFGQYDLHAAQACFRLGVHRDAAAVVGHLDRTVIVQGDGDMVAGTGQRLVHGVVDDLPQAVHQALAVGGTYIHARALAHRVKTFENGQTVRAVVFLCHGPHSIVDVRRSNTLPA